MHSLKADVVIVSGHVFICSLIASLCLCLVLAATLVASLRMASILSGIVRQALSLILVQRLFAARYLSCEGVAFLGVRWFISGRSN